MSAITTTDVQLKTLEALRNRLWEEADRHLKKADKTGRTDIKLAFNAIGEQLNTQARALNWAINTIRTVQDFMENNPIKEPKL